MRNTRGLAALAPVPAADCACAAPLAATSAGAAAIATPSLLSAVRREVREEWSGSTGRLLEGLQGPGRSKVHTLDGTVRRFT
jgi:hypothetical protein